MPLGEGYSVEEQLTGEPKWGGVQILVYPMKADRYETLHVPRRAYAPIRLCLTAPWGSRPAGG